MNTQDVVTPGLLRVLRPLVVPTRSKASPDTAPRIVFEPLTRRQKLLIDELQAQLQTVNDQLAQADQVRLSTGKELGVCFDSDEAYQKSLAPLAGDPRLGPWLQEVAARYAPLLREHERITDLTYLVWPHALVGDWSLVVAEWGCDPTWPALAGQMHTGLEKRADLALDWPQEVFAALKAHIKAGLSHGTQGLTDAEAGNSERPSR